MLDSLWEEPATVRVEMLLRPVAPQARIHAAVRARLWYASRDPYAVHLLFYAERQVMTWSFARELLASGLDQPAGIGDVRVWPSPWAAAWGGDRVVIALSLPDGRLAVEVSRGLLARFLRRTYNVVARGREGAYQDVDATVARLLS